MINPEAEKCLLCKVPKCSSACAVKTDVPGVMKLYREGHKDEAAAILFKNNPFSVITSIVCDWHKNCLGHCVLNARKSPVRWHEIEYELSSEYIFRVHPEVGDDNGKCVAIVGAGPAGITAALELRRKGCRVKLYDSNEFPGGILRYGIPEFRLDRRFIEEYDRLLDEAGVEFFGDTTVTSCKILREECDAVLVTAGAISPRKLDIPGEDNPNIVYALDYLKNPDNYNLGKRVIVVGGGNVTMDACRTANRKGHETQVCYRKGLENMPANTDEVKEAISEGIKFELFSVPTEIRGQKAIVSKCENIVLPNGRITTRIIEGSGKEVEFDSMLVAISANVDYSLLHEINVEFNSRYPSVSELNQTSEPDVFVAGDYILGPSTVVESVQSAKLAVRGIETLFGHLE